MYAARPSAAEQRPGALGAKGEVYMTEVGAFGDLFPGTRAPRGLSATSQVLALDILAPDSAPQRVLVPNTDGSALESTPALLYEDGSKTLYAVWGTHLNSLHSVLYLASFDGASWSNPIQIAGNPFAAKVSSRLAVTRDSYLDTTVTPWVTRARTVLHLAWAEPNGKGLLEVSYTPLIFEDGVFLGFDPSTVQNLNSLERSPATGLPVSPDLAAALNMQNGRDGNTVVVSFASATTGRLNTLEIDVLPRELSLIADRVRGQITTIGPRYYPAQMQDLAGVVATGIMAIGADFHPEVLQPIADRVHDAIAQWAGGPLQNLADNAGAMIIDSGFKLSGRGLFLAPSAAPQQLVQAGPSSSSTLQLAGSSSPGASTSSSSSQWLQFRLDSSRPVPAVGAAGFHILASPSGRSALVEWQQDSSHIGYSTSQGSGWSDPHTIQLSDQLTLDQALAYLQQRLR
jgi:hypothetical protein